MSVYQAFDSFSENAQKNSWKTKVSFYSSTGKEELEEYIDKSHPPGYGSILGGYVESVTYRQEGPVWYADVSIWRERSELTISIIRRPLKHSLRAVSISLPLSKRPGYLTKWDHFLWQRVAVTTTTEGESNSGTGGSGETSEAAAQLPIQYDSATTDAPFESGGVYYRWTKDGSDLDGAPKNGYLWKCIATPTKPCVETWDFHTYQITEYGEYPSEAYAAWVTDIMIDHVRDKPLLGDFGISSRRSGNWKCDDASVEFDGKHWCASLVWTLSGDENGWDSDLYDEAESTSAGTSLPGSTSSTSGNTVASNSGTLGANMNWIEIT